MSDNISRQAALDAVYKIAPVDTEYDCTLLDRIDVRYVLTELPSAEPKRPRGKWLSHDDYCKKHGYIPSGLIAFWWCDQCEQGVDYSTNFCPNCGADMRGEENE